jgi:hypothetical protein
MKEKYPDVYQIIGVTTHNIKGISFLLDKIGDTSGKNLFCIRSEMGKTWKFVDE